MVWRSSLWVLLASITLIIGGQPNYTDNKFKSGSHHPSFIKLKIEPQNNHLPRPFSNWSYSPSSTIDYSDHKSRLSAKSILWLPFWRETKNLRKPPKPIEDELSENLSDDDKLLNMEANQQTDQEDLTQEQRNETIYKKLTSKTSRLSPTSPNSPTKIFSLRLRISSTKSSGTTSAMVLSSSMTI